MALLLSLLQEHFRTGEASVIDIDGLWLKLDGGRLFVDSEDARVEDLLSAGESEAAAALEGLAPRLAGRHAARTDADSSGGGNEPRRQAGPFPAAPLVAALATLGARARTLESRLGGIDQRFEVAVPTVDVGALTPEAVGIIDRLYARPTLGELLDGAEQGTRDRVLASAAILHALGVLVPIAVQAPESSTRTLTERLRERVAERLELEPVSLEPDRHRRLIADRFRQLGDHDHYAFLDVEPGCEETEVTAAFERMARRFHPCHAERLGLASDDAILEALFARAVEAYYALIDPDRRIAYNRELRTSTATRIDEDQRRREKQTLAEESVSRALMLLKDQEVSAAVDLLQQSVRLSPSADTFALLARALARNPAWRRRAIGAWEDALELRRDWPEAHLAIAELHEEMDRPRPAIKHYRHVLDLDPGHADARVALSRLGESDTPAKRRLPWRR